MTRPRRNAILPSPVLVGAVTVLVTIVAVFLAYNANSGLPFVPSYELRAVLADASELTVGNDVRVGGSRVGQVQQIRATVRQGRPVAVVEMQLEKAVEPLRSDTVLLIRQRSNVGLKYIELRPGETGRPLADGAVLDVARGRPPVDLDDALSVFDAPTRGAVREVLDGFGGGLAGRGADLNRSLASLPDLLLELEGASRVLRGRRAALGGFIGGAASAAATAAPVAENLAGLFDSGAVTLNAIARERSAFGDFFDEAAALERDGAQALRVVRPVLAEATALAAELRPGVAALPDAGGRIALGLRRSAPPLLRTRDLAAPLRAAVGGLRRFSRDPDTTPALLRLTEVLDAVVPTLEHFNPIQTRCNALGIWTRNVPSVVSEGDQSGTWFRFVVIQKPDESQPRATPAPDLHYYTIPDAGQGGECEAGNERYVNPDGREIGRVPGVQPGYTEDTPRGTLAERVAAEAPQR